MENYKSLTVNLSVIIPCFNEERAIGKVIDEVRESLLNYNDTYEIIVVNDCSEDNSEKVVRSRNVHLINLKERFGAGYARKRGIENCRGEIIVMLDGDGSYDPSLIPQIMRYFPDYDQVNACRSSEYGLLKYLRLFAKKLFSLLASVLAFSVIPDINTGYKAFKKSLILPYLDLIPNGFSCVSTINLIYYLTDKKVKNIQTEYRIRIGQSKFHPMHDTFKMCTAILRIVYKLRKTRLIFFSAIVLSVTLMVLVHFYG